MARFDRGRSGVLIFAVMLAAGCNSTITPTTTEPVAMPELERNADRYRETLFRDQEKTPHPISLAEAMARAIKYNLDHQIKQIEEALARGQIELAQLAMLPQANIEETTAKGSAPDSPMDGTVTLPKTTSKTRDRTAPDLTRAWNLLDYGVSYATAQQTGDQFFITQERRRKAVQEIMRQVNVVWWKAAGAAFLEKDLNEVLERTRRMVQKADALTNSGGANTRKGLEYQRGLLDIEQHLLNLRRHFRLAKLDLANLIHEDSNQPIAIALPDMNQLALPEVGLAVTDLERLALLNRPELRESLYQERIDAQEIRNSYKRLLPSMTELLSRDIAPNPDAATQPWHDNNFKLSYNLVNLANVPNTTSVTKIKGKLADLKQLAIAMAVISQVHVSYENMGMLYDEYRISSKLERVNIEIYREIQSAKSSKSSKSSRSSKSEAPSSEFELILQAANALEAKMRNISLFGEIQNVFALLKASLGLDSIPPGTSFINADVATLAHIIEEHDLKVNNLAGDHTVANMRHGQKNQPSASRSMPIPLNP